MYLIVGLGNPEPEYSRTRHNMGVDVINEMAKRQEIELSRTKFNGIYGSGIIEEEKVILLKPQTFMNVLVIYDDMDVEIGSIKLRKKGGPRNSQWGEISST